MVSTDGVKEGENEIETKTGRERERERNGTICFLHFYKIY